jgi:hypothetical protein
MLTPHVEGPSLVVGTIVGVVTAVTQQPVNQMGMLGDLLSSPLGSAFIAAIVAFSTIKTSVKIMERDLHEVRKDLKDVATRVARIEGKLESNP